MKNFKRLAAAALAATMALALSVSAFAENDTYSPNKPTNTDANYTAADDTTTENIKLTSVDFMTAGEQYTVVLFKVDTDASGNISIDSVNRTLSGEDLLYINQGDKSEEFWLTTGMGPKGEGLEEGSYILRIGGKNVSPVYEIPVTVEIKSDGTVEIIFGDFDGVDGVTATDWTRLNAWLNAGEENRDKYNKDNGTNIGEIINGMVMGDFDGVDGVTATDWTRLNAWLNAGEENRDKYNEDNGTNIGITIK